MVRRGVLLPSASKETRAERSPVLGSSGDRLSQAARGGGWARVGLHPLGLHSCCSFTRLLWDHLPRPQLSLPTFSLTHGDVEEKQKEHGSSGFAGADHCPVSTFFENDFPQQVFLEGK